MWLEGIFWILYKVIEVRMKFHLFVIRAYPWYVRHNMHVCWPCYTIKLFIASKIKSVICSPPPTHTHKHEILDNVDVVVVYVTWVNHCDRPTKSKPIIFPYFAPFMKNLVIVCIFLQVQNQISLSFI